ncbi:MAG TPA: hypothetical protein VD926_07295, partial [Acidimicrobiales bacterium]|nr:hypothetical protein [Acidimicrobiales bacterium]
MPREVMFRVEDRTSIVDRMAELADGSGWIVFDAAVDEEDLPPPPGLVGIFTAKGPEAPELSWVPGERGGRR